MTTIVVEDSSPSSAVNCYMCFPPPNDNRFQATEEFVSQITNDNTWLTTDAIDCLMLLIETEVYFLFSLFSLLFFSHNNNRLLS